MIRATSLYAALVYFTLVMGALFSVLVQPAESQERDSPLLLLARAEGASYSLDTTRWVRDRSGTYLVWIEILYAEPQAHGARWYDRIRVREEYDCAREVFRSLLITVYRGSQLIAQEEPDQQRWKSNRSGSVGDLLLVRTCQYMAERG
jgi:hypothetical protein